MAWHCSFLRPSKAFLAASVLCPNDTVGKDLLSRTNHYCIRTRVIVPHPVNFKAVVTLCRRFKLNFKSVIDMLL